MNGVHDMGGMQDMGPLSYEKNEPVFQAPWEKRVFAIWWSADTPPNYRYQAEILPPAEYLSLSYYDRMLMAMTQLMLKAGMITEAELGGGKAGPSKRKCELLTAVQVPTALVKSEPMSRDLPIAPRFSVGHRVRVRNLNPVTHTRQPRYTRGKFGTLERDHGVFNFDDTATQELGDNPQHVYSVRFTARELWGPQGNPRDCVYVDMWEDYLEPA